MVSAVDNMYKYQHLHPEMAMSGCGGKIDLGKN